MEKSEIIILSIILLNFIGGVIHLKVFIDKKLGDLYFLQRRDDEVLQKWLFDSLYSMNNKVVLPETHEIKEEEIIEPVKVYSPSKDPVNSLKGMKNDWHGDA